jgi:hypothetical protein
MAMEIPKIQLPPTLQAFFDLLRLERGPGVLPESTQLMGATVVIFGVLEAALDMMDHSILGSIAFGVLSAGFLVAFAYGVLKAYKREDAFVRVVTAMAGTGAAIALISIVLHFVFAIALPPPLPSDRLVRFLLFPMIAWMVFLYSWILRHVSIRTIPAFAAATTYVIVVDWIFGTLLH